MSTSSLLYFSGYDINPSIRSSARWNNILVNNFFCQCTDTSLGNNNAGRKSKSISRVRTCVRKIKIPSLAMEVPHWFSQRMALCWGRGVGLCAVGRSASQQRPSTERLQEVDSPCCWAYALLPWPLQSWGLCKDRDCWEKKLTSREQMISSTCLLKNFSGIITLRWLLGHRSSHSVVIQRDLPTYLFPRNLPTVIIKLCPFQVPEQPAKLLIWNAAHVSKSIHISGHL